VQGRAAGPDRADFLLDATSLVTNNAGMFSWKRHNVDGRSRPLSHCPICLYDLAGLPNNHKCPECGFAYDESMRVWTKELSPLRAKATAILTVVCTIVFVSAVLYVGVQRSGWEAVIRGRATLVMYIVLLIGGVAFVVGIKGWNAAPNILHEIVISKKSLWIRNVVSVCQYDISNVYIPHPDDRFVVSPWSAKPIRNRSRSRLLRLWTLLNTNIDLIHWRLGVIAVRETESFWTTLFRERKIDLRAITSLPRSARREAMLEIHERWKQALQDRIAHSEDSSPA
jgi:hypothetical protein